MDVSLRAGLSSAAAAAVAAALVLGAAGEQVLPLAQQASDLGHQFFHPLLLTCSLLCVPTPYA